MHTGYYVGIFLAAILNYTIGAKYGWRAMFAFGGAPALLVGFIRFGVKEPERWQQTARQVAGPRTHRCSNCSRPSYDAAPSSTSFYLLISMTGLWAGSVYVPSSVTHLATRAGYDSAQAARLASWATMLLSAATIVGCLIMTPLAERIGRRATLGVFFALMFVSIAFGFGYAFYFCRSMRSSGSSRP